MGTFTFPIYRAFSVLVSELNITSSGPEGGGTGLLNSTLMGQEVNMTSDLDCPEFNEDRMRMVDEFSFWVEGVTQVKIN